MPNIIKKRLDSGQIVRLIAVSQFASPKFVEIAGIAADVHGIWVDQEHGAVPHAQLELLLIACRAAGLDAFSRVTPTDYATIMRPMEVGCSGVMAAQIRTLDEVRQVVNCSKYPPLGIRGLFTGCAESRFGQVPVAEHIERANKENWLAIQIETAEAVEIVDQIAAADGVDWLFVGPSDLSCNLGVPGQTSHPIFVEALKRVSAAVEKAGKHWGTLARDMQYAQICYDLGCRLFSVGGELDLVLRGLQATKEMFPTLFAEK